MMTPPPSPLTIRPVRPEQYELLGKLLVKAYAALPGMPQPDEQPDYYAMLADVAGRAARPALTVFVATNEAGELLGSIDFIDDMRHYGSGGPASTVTDAAGVRLLAVDGTIAAEAPARRWRGSASNALAPSARPGWCCIPPGRCRPPGRCMKASALSDSRKSTFSRAGSRCSASS
jgi:hypothetical protein